jgi:hypothetical protein
MHNPTDFQDSYQSTPSGAPHWPPRTPALAAVPRNQRLEPFNLSFTLVASLNRLRGKLLFAAKRGDRD